MSDTGEKGGQKGRSQAVLYVVGDGEHRLLLVEVAIACPVCGEHRFQITGHHVQMVRDILIDAMDKYPELTRSDYTKLGERRFTGRSNDPSTS